ncbi:MAG: tyrosine-type recombinase/integrase [Rhizomicrobium sp.]|jgi:integrase
MSRSRKGKIFEIGEWWLDRVAGSSQWYGFRYDAESGRVRRESLGVTDFEDAKLALSSRALIAAPKKSDSYLSAILESYFEEVSDKKPSGVQARFAGALLLKFWGSTSRASDVTERKQLAFAEWCRNRGKGKKPLSVSYIARNLSVLSAAMHHALGDHAPRIWVWPSTVAAKLDIAEPEPRDWIPTDVQLAAFLDSLVGHRAEHVFRYTILALNTLARPAALLELTQRQVDRDLGLITLNPATRRQTKKRRPIVRVSTTLEPWLEAWATADNDLYVSHNGKQIASIRATFKRKGRELGMPEFSPYTLRHKMATELRARGVSREELAYQMGTSCPTFARPTAIRSSTSGISPTRRRRSRSTFVSSICWQNATCWGRILSKYSQVPSMRP